MAALHQELDPNEQISVGFKLPWYLSGNEGKQSLRDNSFLTYIILYNTLIPLSLYVSLEVVRFGNSKQVNNDETMADAEVDIKPNCRNTNIMEELGQVRYVFTDKTGTLTRNEMKLVRAVVAGRSYDVGDVGAYRTDLCNDELLRDFTLNMALCNTVLPCAPRDAGADADAGAEGKGLESKHSQGAREYQAESPDEQTLVETCAVLGCSMTHRDQKTITLGVSPGTQWVAAKDGGESSGGNGGSQLVYEILLVLPFDSVRKRMSVVVRAPDGQVVVFCKGADASMHWVLSDASEEQDWSAADLALGSMAGAGLRTLVMAHKRMDAGEFAEVEEAHQQALDELDPEKHLALMQRVSELVECELTLSGVSGIEDKLQDKVPECIAALRSAGISVWVLTGDKQETAISIGYTSQALSKDCDLLIFNERVPVDLAQSMQAHCTRFGLNVSTLDQESEMQGALQTPVSIVIDGPTLSIVLAEPGTKAYHPLIGSMFLSLAKMSGSVVCCRCTPLQKSSIVRLVAERSTLVGDGAVTLAIGDGANDVSMIQEAHVGVGISGKEGMQCVLAADFSLPNFKGIRPLLLVHGYQIYRRISKVILYSFCKNFALAFVAFWFSFYNKFSGQLVFFDLSFTLYNALFTALPILAVGLGDEDVARWVLGHTDEGMKLYSNGLNHMALNTRSFFGWVCLGIWHSFIIFVVGFFFVGEVLPNGQNLGLWELGLACFTYLVFNMSAQILLLARRWTKALKLTVFLSVFNFWWFALAYCSATYVPVLENLTTSNAHWSIYMIAQAPRYWFGIVFCIVLGVLPNYIVKSVSIFFGGRQSYDVASIERRYKTDEAHEYFMLNDAGESMPGAADMGAGDDKDFRMNTLDRRYRRESSSGPKGYWCP
jgi:phospholipid-transporting ATPase